MDYERIKRVSEGARTFAEALDTYSQKAVVFLEAWAKELDKQVEQYQSEREEAMRSHPAGKGRVDNDTVPSREGMRQYIVRNGPSVYVTVYEDKDFIDSIPLGVVERDYNVVKSAVENGNL